MDNLRSSIDLLFNRQSHNSILDSFWNYPERRADKYVGKDWFCRYFSHDYNIYSYDQIGSIYQILHTKWLFQDPDFVSSVELKSVFNVLSHFTYHVLVEIDNEPVCKYEKLLRWHEMSLKVGEDLLCTSYLALKDELGHSERHNFAWRPVITHNNTALKHIFKSGISDLHFHLKGSSLNFDLNWLSLMNCIDNRKTNFKTFNKLLSFDIHTNQNEHGENLHELCVKAAAIRFFLTQTLRCIVPEFYPISKLENIFKAKGNEILMYDNELQRSINQFKNQYGYKFKNQYGSKFDTQVVDYAIPPVIFLSKEKKDKFYSNSILCGERWFLYSMFRQIYSGNKDYIPFSNWFYYYVSVKCRIRKELIQVNDKIGFANFANYDKRKEMFIREKSIYELLVPNLAINCTFNNQNVDYVEARIKPKEKSIQIKTQIKTLDQQINPLKNKQKNFHYIFHYIKENHVVNNILSNYITPRNWLKRNEVKKQTIAIHVIRSKYPSISNRIVGIDAANSEFGCRPEVFAQAFRFLKYIKEKNTIDLYRDYSVPDLGFTFHVGEDFYDIADGLRAIDETILFLNFTRSNRLGHALALGVDSRRYYFEKNKTIIMPKHDFLDNVVWLLVIIRKFGLEVPEKLIFKLETWFEQYYLEIYEYAKPTIFTYYQSWLLRGDDPLKYTNPDDFPLNDTFGWQKYALNAVNNEVLNARNNPDARNIYFRYHFDPKAKERGLKSDEYLICPDYIDMIDKLQAAMRKDISEKNLSIETNLTSNTLIGAYKRYSGHPITKFFNIGLEQNEIKLRSRPQICISINTDDQGVFATSVENEFSLMALSLEKQMDEYENHLYSPRMVYSWLENVRKMAEEQKFKKD